MWRSRIAGGDRESLCRDRVSRCGYVGIEDRGVVIEYRGVVIEDRGVGIKDRGVVIEDRGVGIEFRCANILASGIAG